MKSARTRTSSCLKEVDDDNRGSEHLYERDSFTGSKSVSTKTVHENADSEVFEKETIVVASESKDNLEPYSIKHKLSKTRKWFIIFIVALQGLLGPLSSSIYIPAVVQVKQSFQASDTAINATISSYIFTLGVSPLIWATLSERYGRRLIYLLATMLYLGATLGCALSYSISLFIPMRILQSIGAAAAQAVGAGTITDLFDVHERGNAMGLFLLGALIGPVLGPIFGGLINEFLGWRYIFWFLTVVGGLTLILIIFFLPETSAAVLKRRILVIKRKEGEPIKLGYPEADQLRRRNQATIIKETETSTALEDVSIDADETELHANAEEKTTTSDCCSSLVITADSPSSVSFLKTMARPFKFMLKPLVILATTPYSMAYGFMYFVIATLPHELHYHYSLASYQIGLAYLANGIGNALGAYISGKLSDRALNKSNEKNHSSNSSDAQLEARLSPMWLGIILLPIGELIYGWCSFFGVHVAATLAGLFVCLGVGVVQTPSNTYIVDSYQTHSASVMSAANMLRCLSAGCTPLVAPSIIRAIGNGWSMTIIAVLSVMSGVCIAIVQHFGSRWRTQ